MSLSPMSHVEFKKCSCHPVNYHFRSGGKGFGVWGGSPIGFSRGYIVFKTLHYNNGCVCINHTYVLCVDVLGYGTC